MKPLAPARLAAVLAGLAALLLAALAAGVAIGPSELAPGEALRALLDPSAGPAGDIVRRIRLPRVGAAALVGAALALAGVCFQALLHNPLADPYVLGISGGAALGGVAVLSLGAAVGLGAVAVPPAAFAGALGATALLFGVAGWRGRLSATTLLLTGVVFNAFASAAIVFLASLGGMSEGAGIFLWLIGTLSSAGGPSLAVLAVLLAAGLACAWALARSLDLLTLGDDTAEQLGVAVERTKRLLLLATALVVGGAVSVSGLIGFVGLIVPHALRLLFGPDHRLLVPAAALAGAAFLVLCDTLARTVLPGRELPVGAITALVGGPLFLVLLRRQGSAAGERVAMRSDRAARRSGPRASEPSLPGGAADGGALHLEGITLRLGVRTVLDGVDLAVRPGEVLGLLGRNGAGKTSLLRIAGGLAAPDAGAVAFDGRPLAALGRRERARAVAVVPQETHFPFPYSVAEVVLMGRAPHLGWLGFERRRDREAAAEAMTQLGIEALAGRSVLGLSGGERQLAVVARALAQEPRLLLLDEPTAFLDLRHRLAVLARVRAFAAAGGAALVVSHDLAVAARACDRLALLAGGRILAAGAPAEVLTPALLREAFAIEADVLATPDGHPVVVPRTAGFR